MWQSVITLLKWLFGPKTKPSIPADTPVATPLPDVTVVSSRIGTPPTRWYMSAEMINLLGLIRQHESGRAGYDADYRNDDRWHLTNKTFNQVRELSRLQVRQGEASSAIGAYQFLTRTLDSLKSSLKLSGDEIFNEVMQDDLAVALMIRRGLLDYLRGTMRATSFANNLAKEWASLPVVTAIKGARRQLKVGQSFYAGDGLNRAFHSPDIIMSAVEALRTPYMVEKAREAR